MREREIILYIITLALMWKGECITALARISGRGQATR